MLPVPARGEGRALSQVLQGNCPRESGDWTAGCHLCLSGPLIRPTPRGLCARRSGLQGDRGAPLSRREARLCTTAVRRGSRAEGTPEPSLPVTFAWMLLYASSPLKSPLDGQPAFLSAKPGHPHMKPGPQPPGEEREPDLRTLFTDGVTCPAAIRPPPSCLLGLWHTGRLISIHFVRNRQAPPGTGRRKGL